MYSTLKRLGSRPGDLDEFSTFSLPSHIEHGFTAEQSVETIARHFAEISQEYRPLVIDNLPERVKEKLKFPGSPPSVSEFETYLQINAAKKPKSGVPSDMPRKITKEFAPELAAPMSKIINNLPSE